MKLDGAASRGAAIVLSFGLLAGACGQSPTASSGGQDGRSVVATSGLWRAGRSYSAGDLVSFDGIVYQCRKAHKSKAGWEPPRTSALWMRPTPTEIVEWTVQTNYVPGTGVLHGGSLYEAIKGHVSESTDWTPARAATLWRCASASCGGGGCSDLRDRSLCDDGNACTGVDRCRGGRCVSGAALARGRSCADGDLCNGAEVCDGRGGCTTGRPVDVDDGDACTADSCQAASGVVGHTADPSLAGCQGLRPELECVAELSNGELIAIFGYSNDLAVNATLPVGPGNGFAPAPANRGQPTVFRPGRQRNEFAVPLAGGSVAWSLAGQTVTASSASPRCSPAPCDGAGGLPVGGGQCVPARSGDLPLAPDTIVATGPAEGQAPGRVAGDLEVTHDGALAYHVQLYLPPGRAQLQPVLSLGYNSRHGDGQLGVGWTLEGVSEISRCKKTIAQNGATGPVRFDDSDVFCLDGVQLIPAGEDAQGRDQFRTETDSFSIVIVTARDALGPVGFEVRSRDGQIHSYGGASSDSVLEGLRNTPTSPGRDIERWETTSSFTETVRLSWGLTETRDRHDNTILYFYRRTPGTPENGFSLDRTLERIEYTGRRDNSILPGHVVFFRYEPRPDVRFSYVSGLRLQGNQRLASVDVFAVRETLAGGAGAPGSKRRERIRTYRLAYRNDRTISGRTLLDAVTECDGVGAPVAPTAPADAVCKRPTRFTYTAGSEGFVGRRTNVTDLVPDFLRSDLHAGDINGDGLDDILYRVPVGAGDARWFFRFNLGPEAGFGPAIPAPFPAGHHRAALSADQLVFDAGRLVDLDMDGNADFLAYEGETPTRSARWRYFYSTGTEFSAVPVEQTELDTFPPTPSFMDFPIYVADVTGDGYPDALRPLWTLQHQQACSMDPSQVPNFDCFQALGVRVNDRGMLTPWRKLVEQKFFPPNVIEVQEFPFQHDDNTAFWFATDVDGDGSVEFLATEAVGSPNSPFLGARPLLRALRLDSNGAVRGSNTTLRWRLSLRLASTSGEFFARKPIRHYFVDVNGDGLADVLESPEAVPGPADSPGFDPQRTTRPYLALNTGNGFAEVNEALLEPSATPVQGLLRRWQVTQDGRGGNVQVIDINQDGRSDLLLLDDGDGQRAAPVVYVAQGEPGRLVAAHPLPPAPSPFAGVIPNDVVRVDPNGSYFTARTQPDIPLSAKAQRGTGASRRASFRLARLGDFDGDGLEDVIQLEADGALHVYSRSAPGAGVESRADLLQQVEDGMGGSALAVYVAISQPTAQYVRGQDCGYPQYCVNRGIVVVRDLFLNASRDGRRHYTYRYEDGRADLLGRGWLGFRVKRARDNDTGVAVTETYDNATRSGTFYPFAGLVTAQTLEATVDGLAGGPPTLVRVNSRTTTYRQLTPSPGTLAVVPGVVTEVESEDGVELRRVTTTIDDYDLFGNGRQMVVESGQPGQLNRDRLERRSTFTNDTARWLIGLLTDTVTTSTGANGETETRTVHLDRQPSTGEVFVETLEPRIAGQPIRPEFLQTVLGRDAYGNITSITDFDATGDTRQVEIAYDRGDQMFPVQTRSKLGVINRFAFIPAFGELAAREDVNGLVTRWQFDGFGRPTHQERPDAADLDIRYAIPAGGVGIEVTSVRRGGRQVVVQSDHLGREVMRKERGFDGVFNVVHLDYERVGRNIFRTSRPVKEPETNLQFNQLEVDNLGRPRFERFADGTFREYQYGGLTTVLFDQKRNMSQRDQDQLRRIVRSIEFRDEAHPVVSSYRYGAFGLLRLLVDTDGNTVEPSYDRRGRRTRLIDPDSGTATFEYNGFGELTAGVDGNGLRTTYSYDGDGRPRTVVNRDGVDTFEWDSAPNGIGLLAGSSRANLGVDEGFVSTRYRYDQLSQMVAADWQIRSAELGLAFTYDEFGRRRDTTYPAVAGRDRLVVRNTYNEATGELQQVAPAGSPTALFWRADARDAFNRLTAETFGNGVVTTIGYDPVRDVLQRRIDTRSSTGVVLQAFSYDYDPAGNLQSRRDERAGIGEGFDYDGLNRLTRWRYEVDDGGQFTIRYDWSDLGNLVGRIVERGPGADNTFTYAEPNANGGPHAVTFSSVYGAYAYDDKGNQVRRPGQAVTYTAFDLPKAITTSEGRTEFGYDARHRRAWKRQEGGRETIYVDNLYERRSQGGRTNHLFHVHGANGAIAQVETEVVAGRATDRTRYLHAEHLGSIETVSDGSGTVERRFKLDPWGLRIDPGNPNREESAPPGEVHRGFTGHEHDDELRLINMGGRIYDPRTTRFLSPDAETSDPFFGPALNRYAYAFDNPLRFFDPLGNQAVDSGVFRHPRPPNPLPGLYGRKGASSQQQPSSPKTPQVQAPTQVQAPKLSAPPAVIAPKGDDQQTVSTRVPTRPPPAAPGREPTPRGTSIADVVNFLLPAHTGYAQRPPVSTGNPYGDVVQRANQQAVTALGNATRETAVFAIQGASASLSAAQMALEMGAELVAQQAALRLLQRAPDIVVDATTEAAEVVVKVSRGGTGPVRQGAAGVERVAADIEAAGGKVLGREITIDAGGVTTKPDLFVELASGRQIFVEVKTGASATWTPNQVVAFPHIWTQGGVPRGANAAAAGLAPGVAIPATPVWTVHMPWPLP